MKILYLGTGAAEGVPAVFCNCDTCREARRRGEKEFHSRSQVLIDGLDGERFGKGRRRKRASRRI